MTIRHLALALASAAAFVSASEPARAEILLDLVNPAAGNSSYSLTFVASADVTTLSVAGYQKQTDMRATANGVFLANTGTNLLGAEWTSTPAASGSFAFQDPDGNVNSLIFSGVSEISYDVFSQAFATIAGMTYNYNFQFSNCCTDTAGLNAPSGFRVSTESVAGAVPEPASWALMIVGFGLVGASMRRKALIAA